MAVPRGRRAAASENRSIIPALTAPSRTVASRSARGAVRSARHRDRPPKARRSAAAKVSRSQVVPAGPRDANSPVASALPVWRTAMAARTSTAPGARRGAGRAGAGRDAVVTGTLERSSTVSVHDPIVDILSTISG
ncbi:hypothetical protein GCM10010420_40850 [Streptomyces glaucosporus]|uniref:Uncharacterized protein n=1 Tax=Streptomyces glaucosporus TaxID=284044 RepID=A0ABP5VTT7_9ACTN